MSIFFKSLPQSFARQSLTVLHKSFFLALITFFIYPFPMSYDFYKSLHFLSLFLMIFSLGGLWMFYSLKSKESSLRKGLLSLLGLSLVLIFFAGFGLIAKLALPSWPLWLYGKILVWLLLGFSPLFLKRFLKKSHSLSNFYQWRLPAFASFYTNSYCSPKILSTGRFPIGI